MNLCSSLTLEYSYAISANAPSRLSTRASQGIDNIYNERDFFPLSLSLVFLPFLQWDHYDNYLIDYIGIIDYKWVQPSIDSIEKDELISSNQY